MAKSIKATGEFLKWLKKLRDRQARDRITKAVTRLSHGLGDTKSVGGALREVRLTYGPAYRIYYTELDGELIILLCGGDKSSQRQDIERAKRQIAELDN